MPLSGCCWWWCSAQVFWLEQLTPNAKLAAKHDYSANARSCSYKWYNCQYLQYLRWSWSNPIRVEFDAVAPAAAKSDSIASRQEPNCRWLNHKKSVFDWPPAKYSQPRSKHFLCCSERWVCCSWKWPASSDSASNLAFHVETRGDSVGPLRWRWASTCLNSWELEMEELEECNAMAHNGTF